MKYVGEEETLGDGEAEGWQDGQASGVFRCWLIQV